MGNNDESSAVKVAEVYDLAYYRKRIAALDKQMSVFNARLTTKALSELDEADLCVRLEYVEGLNTHFEQAASALDVRGGDESDGDVRTNFVLLFFDAKAKLKRQINAVAKARAVPLSSTVRQFSVDESMNLRKTRLPELKIQQFSGSYTHWPDFYAMFNSVIASDGELSKVEKLQHLRASLTGAALETISSLEPTEANYDKAIELLKNRFDNKLLNFQTHIKEIFGLMGDANGGAAGLRQLSDKMNAHLRALQTICTQEQIADGILVYLVTSKLDVKSRTKWEEELRFDTIPTWPTMATFLERRSRLLENLESSMSEGLPAQQVSKKPNSKGRNVLIASGAASAICNFCDSRDHFISNCSRFGNLSPTLRFKEAKRLGLCLNCLKKGHLLKKCRAGNCRHCSMRHHSLLHMERISQQQESSTQQLAEHASSSSATPSVLISSLSTCVTPEALESPSSNNVLLATVVVMVKNKFGDFVPCRAILDSASQLNFISARAAHQLQLKVKRSYVTISGIGDGSFVADKSADICLKSCHSDYSTSFAAVVVPTITEYQPDTNLNVNKWNIPQNIKLADPQFNQRGRIDLLIGACKFFDLLCEGTIRLGDNSHILKKTVFGWVVTGGGVCSSNSFSLAAAYKSVADPEDDALIDVVRSFWEVENNYETSSNFTKEDVFCEQHFRQNVIRLDSGEYSVRLPKKNNHHNLGNSYDQALHRFQSLEKILNKNLDVKNQYQLFMKEYLDLKHMSLLPSKPEEVLSFFLPHHCVHKYDSTTTKLRVVFDGSAKTSTGLSLNDTLFAGPTIQPKLFETLVRFRFFKIALSGDICKMYRCVRVRNPDDHLQCVLWRNSAEENVKIYKLNTVTYGTKPAAFLAIRAMHQLCLDEGHNFPIGANIVKRDFYVDDLISGGNSVKDVIEIRQQVSELLKLGNFDIRKWCSNNPSVLSGLPSSSCEQFLKFHDGTDITKTLGLIWNPKTDMFIFTFLHMSSIKTVTKRTVLSSIARFYDPLGLIGPVITKAKIFMQNLWKVKLDWDESLPQSLHSSWMDFISKFSFVEKIMFPRFISIPESKIQIHGFCDASLAAYGACIYVRSQINGEVKVELMCSKSRVSPLKVLTVPKLELSAALLLAHLLDDFSKNRREYEFHCWSDSLVVLSWLREEASNYNVFVANRVSRIQKFTENMIWHHIPTALNPADILSRGATPEELFNSKLWKNGPDFLFNDREHWPKTTIVLSELPERRRIVLAASHVTDLSLQCKYHNSFLKIQHTFAYIYRFMKLKSFDRSEHNKGELTSEEVEMGTRLLFRNIQRVHFAAEYKAIKDNKGLLPSSKLHSLSPIIDSFGLIRVGGRLQNSFLNYDAQHPIILPKCHPVTLSLVLYYHQMLMHAGPQCLLAHIRQQYWPIGGRKAVTGIINKCVRCFRLKPKYVEHIMGCLPEARVRPSRAFYTTGIDFCGPFYYKSEVRTRPPIKCYICIFICFATKALHMELVQDLSTCAFLSSLKRFISIRGKPKTIWSDNATNFVGAKNELAELRQLFFNQANILQIKQQCLQDEIHWKFIPPRSPHFGGLWEAAVKAAKFHFYRAVGLSKLTFDELRTLVCQISAILNSRPLCPLTENPDDLEVLTPAHFLVGAPITSFAEPNITDLDISRLSRWQRVCFMQQVFWKKWSCSYLSSLQERSKWRSSNTNIAKGAMVVLKDENLPPLKWQLGRVVEIIAGEDEVVRVALVKTASGTSRRAVAKLAVLPIEDASVESHDLPTGGGC